MLVIFLNVGDFLDLWWLSWIFVILLNFGDFLKCWLFSWILVIFLNFCDFLEFLLFSWILVNFLNFGEFLEFWWISWTLVIFSGFGWFWIIYLNLPWFTSTNFYLLSADFYQLSNDSTDSLLTLYWLSIRLPGSAMCLNNREELGTFKATCWTGLDGLDGLAIPQTTTTARALL